MPLQFAKDRLRSFDDTTLKSTAPEGILNLLLGCSTKANYHSTGWALRMGCDMRSWGKSVASRPAIHQAAMLDQRHP